ncbi:MAG: hypothetical protein ACJ8F7_12880 [Gemmataceae bacterium]
MNRILMMTLCGLAALFAGCSGAGGGRVSPPSLSPSDAAAKAIAEYDTNHDNLLDAKELEKCPGLLAGLDEMDTNKDKKLSADEIAKALESIRDSKIGLMSLGCLVLLDGRPLAGATVRLVPESFLGPAFKPATGTTEDDGNVLFRTEGYDVDGVPMGVYRIEVSKKDAGGKELIPARYNSATTLGKVIAPEARGSMTLKLTSK